MIQIRELIQEVKSLTDAYNKAKSEHKADKSKSPPVESPIMNRSSYKLISDWFDKHPEHEVSDEEIQQAAIVLSAVRYSEIEIDITDRLTKAIFADKRSYVGISPSDGNPEKDLLGAVVERAFFDYVGKDADESESAREWLYAKDNVEEAFTFGWICNQLDLDRVKILEMIELRKSKV